jgi:GntR family transcriptional regulator
MSVVAHKEWGIEFNSGIPVYKQIINHICAALASGTLKEGDQLPTLRLLHEQLEVNPNTVAKAYRELELRGIITSERGSGTFIKAGMETVKLSKAEKKERLESLYRRMLAEAVGSGLTEDEIIKYISERKDHESV